MTLRLRMILGIGTILFVVILAYALIAVRSQTSYLQSLARHEAELIATVAERALARAMERGETETVQAILTRIGQYAVLAGIRIVDPDGKILRSNRPEEIGRVLSAEEMPRRLMPGPVWDHREQTVGIFRPVLNGPSCTGCHSPAQSTLGFLSVRVLLPAIHSEGSRQWVSLMLAAVASLVAAGALIAAFFTLVIGRRIDALSHTISRVEAGDFAARVPQDSSDELGRLGRSFNAMVARLADARRQLEDRHADEMRRAQTLASLGQMVAGIAHEINNPIAGMQNCVRTLLRGPRDEAQRSQYLEMLREGLERIGQTVRHLLNFARESKPQKVETDLTPLLTRCLTLLEHDTAERRISISLRLEPDLPRLWADPHQLEQVFLNILMNALEAMPGGGTLTVEAGRWRRETGQFLEVRVTDTGGGIPPQDLPRIFDPFFTTKEVGKGTGLGLSVSYGIVRAHAGSIDVDTKVGRGTVVTVALPLNGG
ncbi:MAG TPA: ATP-binding protein [Candidatus Sulfotelmatobacter sp.]|nr:ATP-binding protein [Candidatus Sulfotelmatobacter sp.]